ncbi:MAG: efflux RND transporter periplasmic adaptor subunit [Pseudomonadota bacterium]|nr:efflux RND transporter periplasmic adaptor subunit [Pseudomonadota bacterium]
MTRFRFAGPAAALAAALLLAACDDDKAGAQAHGGAGGGGRPPSPVAVIEVAPDAIPLINELPGRIAPTRIAEVRPRVSGILVERVFQQGSRVKAGDVLYRIDSDQFRVQVERAQAVLDQAEAQRTAAAQSAARQVQLRERNVVSAQAFDDANAELAVAEAGVAVAKAALAAAQLDLEHTDVRAPIDGRIGRARATEGALVTALGADSLATIQQLDPVYADFTQSAADLMALRRAHADGALVRSPSGDAQVRLLLDDGTEYAHKGKLLFSEATVDTTTGQVTLRGEFPNPDGDLLPGMYVRVLIEQGVQNDALAVPVQAVQRDMGGKPLVYVVADGRAQARPVRAGRVVGDRWVIDEGLEPGDQVIVEGFQKIGPGAPVAAEPWGGGVSAQAAPAKAG